MLPTSWGASDAGRPTSGSATALKGKSELYRGNWAAAEAAFRTVINSGNYSLLPASDYQSNFGQVNENNAESVFELQYLGIEAFSWGVDIPGVGTMGNFHIDYAPPTKSPDQSHFINSWVKDLFEANGETIRRNATLAYDYPGSTGYGGAPFLDDFAGDIEVAQNDGMEPIFTRKYAGLDIGPRDDVDFLGTNVGNNWRIIRYADVLLMLAEAEVELGNLERARSLVNEVRARAAGCGQMADGTLGAIADGVGNYSVGTYDDAWTDANVARDAVRFERRIELALEGHRFFDLRRWGIGAQVMNKYLDEETPKRAAYLTNAGRYEAKHDLYPLPTVQIELSKVDGEAMIQQNPGW